MYIVLIFTSLNFCWRKIFSASNKLVGYIRQSSFDKVTLRDTLDI